ncbi:hypothetical protein BBOMB_0095 [Bifidobacterium bombi DSM 19703]|uniref:Transmembrane protein n=2 Tax=Bifidobacterium bombi TaxID=471511 RepID=A0A080N5M1_9BIFI|nr:hypothetical protein BBOMB_0095 [Bifidobacterium bombi DSM 19703]
MESGETRKGHTIQTDQAKDDLRTDEAKAGGPSTSMNELYDDEPAISDPAQAMRLVDDESRRLRAMFATNGQALYLTWGLVWLAAYLVLGISSLRTTHGPSSAAFIIYSLLLLTGVATSIICGIKAGTGRRGQSKLKEMIYGWSWFLAFLGGMLMCAGLVRHLGLSGEYVATVYNCTAVLIVGILYMVGSVLADFDLPMFLGGVLMLVIGILMPLLSATVGFFIMAVVGGGSFLVLAGVVHACTRGLNRKRARR